MENVNEIHGWLIPFVHNVLDLIRLDVETFRNEINSSNLKLGMDNILKTIILKSFTQAWDKL